VGAGGIRPPRFSGYIEKYPSQKQEQGIAAYNMISGHKDTEDVGSRKKLDEGQATKDGHLSA
jgi:hypothetical protein